MRRYYITDRIQAGGIEPLIGCIARNMLRGVHMIQIREKDLPARELAALVRRVRALPNPCGSLILMNDRADIALACDLDGVHLPSRSLAPCVLKSVMPPGFVIGVSCHSIGEVVAAGREGADFVAFGPVFAPLSKLSGTIPVGLEGLAAAAHAVAIPVYALGGVTEENAPHCVESGAAGVAGITLFQKPELCARLS